MIFGARGFHVYPKLMLGGAGIEKLMYSYGNDEEFTRADTDREEHGNLKQSLFFVS